MKIFTKQALSALFLTSLIIGAPLCAISANGNEDNVETQEEIKETVTPWYKKPDTVRHLFVVFGTISYFLALALYAKKLSNAPYEKFWKQWKTETFAKIKDSLQQSIQDLTTKISYLPEGQEKDACLTELKFIKRIDEWDVYYFDPKRLLTK